MGGIIVIFAWGALSSLVGGIYNSVSRMIQA
jgi:hypothetical protein